MNYKRYRDEERIEKEQLKNIPKVLSVMEIEKFKEKYVDFSIEELDEIVIDVRYLPEARKAAEELILKKREGVN